LLRIMREGAVTRRLKAVSACAATACAAVALVAVEPVQAGQGARVASGAAPAGRIAFQSNRDGHPEIYIMSADGSAETRITNNTSGNREPAFSNDGRRIAFWTNRDGNAEIYTMNPDGSNQVRITHDPAGDSAPAFSPDGQADRVRQQPRRR
jgi:dipeptidyl aminopeptidase/acylaminoacyl peptidase